MQRGGLYHLNCCRVAEGKVCLRCNHGFAPQGRIPLLRRGAPKGRGGLKMNESKPHRNTRYYKSLPYNPMLRDRARELRKAGNIAEVLLWRQLKKGQVNGWDFDRQKIIGSYIVDFFCADNGLVVEIDGKSHEYR